MPPLARLLAWVAIAVIVGDFLLIPMRTRVFASDWLRTHSPGLLFGSLAEAGSAGHTAGPWWASVMPTLWWAGGSLLCWVAVPWWLVRTLPVRHGMQLSPGRWRDWWPYLALFAVMLPVLVVASRRPDFRAAYPLLAPERVNEWRWATLLTFWAAYAAILFATEYLFRGVLLDALAPTLGISAVAVSSIPYALIHTHKPLPEAFGAIVAGWVLGYLAWRTRSIAGGVMLHIAVAISMDALVLSATGRWPTH